jgi:hypothetical protein
MKEVTNIPGFNIGGSGDGPANTIETLRQHRWIIRKLGPIGRESLIVAKEVTLPELRLERQEILGGLIWYKYAKAVKYEDAQVIFYDTGKFLQEIQAWQDKVYKLDTGIGSHVPGKGYKLDSQFDLLDGSGNTVNSYTFKNSWPALIAQGKLSYTDSEIKVVTITLAYDWVESKPAAAQQASGAPKGGTKNTDVFTNLAKTGHSLV